MDAFTPIIIKCLTCHCSARLFPWGCSDPSLVRSSYRPSFMLYLGVWIVVSATQKVAIVCIREVINHTVFSLLWSYCHSLHSIHHATLDKCRLSRICPPPKKNTHSSVVMTREFIHTHTKSRHTTFTQSLWMCIIYMTYQAEADDWLDPERHQEGPDSQFDINQVLEETPGFLPNCISMILILFSAGKRIFGGLLVNGAAKKKKIQT